MKVEGRMEKNAEEKISGKGRDGSGRGMPRIKSSRNKRDERGGKMYNCCIVILM